MPDEQQLLSYWPAAKQEHSGVVTEVEHLCRAFQLGIERK